MPAPTLATISYAGVPILKGDEAVGVVALYGDRENAFADSDVRLLSTLANAMTRRARERAPLRRDAAPVQGRAAARGRARDHHQRPAGARRRAQHAGDLRRGRRQDPRDLPQRGRRHPDLRPADQPDPLSVRLRGRRSGSRSIPARFGAKGFAAHVLRTRETLVINENVRGGGQEIRQLHDTRHARKRSRRYMCRWSSASRRAGSSA